MAGSLLRARIAALVVSTLVTAIFFAALHGATAPWRILDYLAFAVLASILTWRTGGLESSSVLHASNNVISTALVFALGCTI